jgi:Tol biopolymer transport system component
MGPRLGAGSRLPSTRRKPDIGWLEVANLDGSDRRALTSEVGRRSRLIGDVAWSPDGSRLAFVQSGGSSPRRLAEKSSLYVVNADGTDLHPVAGWWQLGRGIGYGVWAPDGTRIAFAQARTDSYQRRGDLALYVVNADGTGLGKLASAVPQKWPRMGSSSVALEPLGWSPDGNTLVYQWTWFPGGDTRYTDQDHTDIYAINSDGSNRRLLARLTQMVRDPILSPDSRRVAYLSWEDEQIYVVDLEIGSPRGLLDTDADEVLGYVLEITWLSNTELAYGREASTVDDEVLPTTIRSIDAGTGSVRVIVTTDGDETVWNLTISADGQSLAYTTATLDPGNAENQESVLHIASLDGVGLDTYPASQATRPGAQLSDEWAIYLE